MIKFLLLSLLVCSSFAFLSNQECYAKFSKTINSLKKSLYLEVSNEKIDALTNAINTVPQTLSACLGQKMEAKFSTEVPPTCVADLNKAAKIALRMQNEKDNQLLFSKDLFLFERHFQTKVKKNCPLLADVTLQDLKDSATCMQASYRFSLIVQKLVGDLKKADKKAELTDIDKIFTDLPVVLDTCGQHEWADEVRKYLPMDCIHAVEDLVRELAVVEHHYSHFEWLVKNYKGIEVYFQLIKVRCPFAFKI